LNELMADTGVPPISHSILKEDNSLYSDQQDNQNDA